MINILCMKWGTRYGPEYVNILYAMVKRHLSIPFRFVCFTDDATHIRSEVECLPLPPIDVPEAHAVSPWRKLALFQFPLYDLSGKSLFFDLDLVIVDSIDCFAAFSEQFSIIENWTQAGQGIGNSSIYAFHIGEHEDVYSHYMENPLAVVTQYDNEQIYLSKKIGNITFWPDSWCKSFKRHALPKGVMAWIKRPAIPKNAKIVVFHGDPKPSDAAAGIWPGRILKHVRPTPWIYEHWRE